VIQFFIILNSGKSHPYESFTFVSLQFTGTIVLACNNTRLQRMSVVNRANVSLTLLPIFTQKLDVYPLLNILVTILPPTIFYSIPFYSHSRQFKYRSKTIEYGTYQ
jgi:hypothetical protein